MTSGIKWRSETKQRTLTALKYKIKHLSQLSSLYVYLILILQKRTELDK